MEDNITLKRAVEIAIGTEIAQKNTRTFSTEQQEIHRAGCVSRVNIVVEQTMMLEVAITVFTLAQL